MKYILKFIATVVLIVGGFILLARIFFPLPNISGRAEITAVPASAHTRLGTFIALEESQHPGKTGVYPLKNGHDALASRIDLAAVAEHSIDAQYYIWHDDTSGVLLLDALNKAAPRGVRVRLLLDDSGVGGLDSFMAALNAQDNFEIGCSTHPPSATPKQWDIRSTFFRMNRRMHNTAFIVDGAEVRILTNAMDTTVVLMVHAGYTTYRRELLEAGVSLSELKLRGAASEADLQLQPLGGLSGASLHTKTFALDGRQIFIGSFNFDQRSALLNCEMGFLIDSPSLACQVSAGFDDQVLTTSYQPELTPEGKMIWREPRTDGKTVIYQQEPGATWWQQAAIVVIGLLPVEWSFDSLKLTNPRRET